MRVLASYRASRRSRATRCRLVLGALMIGALAVGPAVASQPQIDVAADVEIAGTARFLGRADLTGALIGIEHRADAPSSLQLQFTFERARIRVLNAPYALATWQVPGSTPETTHVDLPPETIVNETGSGSLRLLEAGPMSRLSILPKEVEGELGFSVDGNASLAAAPRSAWMPTRDETWFLSERIAHPNGTAAALERRDEGETKAWGPTYAFLYGGTWQLDLAGSPPRTISSGERWNPNRSVAEPSGTYGAQWFDRTVLVLEGEEVRTQVSGTSSGALLFAVERMQGDLIGDLTLADVAGEVRLDEEPASERQQLLQTIGSFEAAADYSSPGRGRWTFSGPATFVGVDGATVAGDRNAHRWPTAALVAGGLGVLAIAAAFLTHVGRELLSLITGRNVAQPLESQTRLLFLREISRHPGLTLRDLAARAGITKWGAMHHVAVLKRAHLIDEVRSGNVATFMLNSHSYRFRTQGIDASGGRGVDVASAFAELGHPKRRLLKETLARHGPSHYGQLLAAWKQDGVPEPLPTPSDVTYHATRMEAAGLLRRRREGPHVIWDLNVDLEQVRSHQWRAWMRDPLAAAVVEAVRGRPGCDAREIARVVSRSRRRRPLEAVQSVLRVLEEAGWLARLGAGYRLAEPVPSPSNEPGAVA